MTSKVLMIDNYDSFTWNVYQYLVQAGANVTVFRNDKISIQECEQFNPTHIVISPGPGKPSDAQISNDVIKAFAGRVPIFGVCLGEQCIYEIFGGVVTYAGEIKHGKTSVIRHDGRGVFSGLSPTFEVIRYHSLAGDPTTLPNCLEITAQTDNGIVMGVRHREFIIEGVQFHPESIKSECGMPMFSTFLKWSGGRWSDLSKDIPH